MGNQYTCCRQAWTLLDDSDESSYQNELDYTQQQRQFSNLAFSNPNLAGGAGGGDRSLSRDDDGIRSSVVELEPSRRSNAIQAFSTESLKVRAAPNRRSDVDVPAALPFQPSTSLSRSQSSYHPTQHISEREPEELSNSPSRLIQKPSSSASTTRSKPLRRRQQPATPTAAASSKHQRPDSCLLNTQSAVRDRLGLGDRWSSCSSVFIGPGCLAKPDQRATLLSIALAVGLLIRRDSDSTSSKPAQTIEAERHRVNRRQSSPSSHSPPNRLYPEVYRLFDEQVNPLGIVNSVSLSNGTTTNDGDAMLLKDVQIDCIGEVFAFLNSLFKSALLGPECAIVALIFLERLVNAAEICVLPWSWRRQLLACILLASKTLDDQAVWNTDFCSILRGASIGDLNALERHTLNLLQFNIDVSPSVYARYYFDLLAVAEAANLPSQSGIGQPQQRRPLSYQLACQLNLMPPHQKDALRPPTSSSQGCLFDLAYGSSRSIVSTTVCNQLDNDGDSGKLPYPQETKKKLNSRPALPSKATPYSLRTSISTSQHQGVLEIDEETDFINCMPTMATNGGPKLSQSFGLTEHRPPPSSLQLNPLPFYSTTFVKSLMGGEAACSLLRDAGIY